MAWDALTGSGVRRWTSAAESERFGLSMGRVVVGTDSEDGAALRAELRATVAAALERLLVVRYPAAMMGLGAELIATGRDVLPADVLTYWECPASMLAEVPADAEPTLSVAPADVDEESREALATVLTDSFRGYGNHYTANPMLDPDLALQGYLEWAMGAFGTNPHNVILLRHGDDVVGAATVIDGSDHLEIELAGLTGKSQGQGWYRVLLAGIGQEALRRGSDRVIISTQVSNIRVQRAWLRAGMKLFAAVATAHAMAPGNQ